MLTEQEARNSPYNTEKKLFAVLEYFLTKGTNEVFNAINDNQFEVDDVIGLLNEFDN